MAQAGDQLTTFRRRTTELLDEMNEIYDALAVVEASGADDAARAAFFQAFFDNSPGYDITSADFFAAVVKMRELRTWLETTANRVPLFKMRL